VDESVCLVFVIFGRLDKAWDSQQRPAFLLMVCDIPVFTYHGFDLSLIHLPRYRRY
jgi:hypothetical protein